MNNIPYVQPIMINSPYDGGPIRPQIRTRESNGNVYTEAHWICPNTGQFVKKGVIKIEPIKK
jgi:hypothetical protein